MRAIGTHARRRAAALFNHISAAQDVSKRPGDRRRARAFVRLHEATPSSYADAMDERARMRHLIDVDVDKYSDDDLAVMRRSAKIFAAFAMKTWLAKRRAAREAVANAKTDSAIMTPPCAQETKQTPSTSSPTRE